MSMHGDRLDSLAYQFPGLREGASGVGRATVGIQRMFHVPVGPNLLVDGVTYKRTLFIAPCDGCYIKEIWGSSSVAINGGTNTIAIDNYDKSASAARNVLSATNLNPATYFPALTGIALTLTATPANLWMDEGDCLNSTLVCGTMTTDGQGQGLTIVVVVPEIT
jgi:hypothetical protein